MVRSRFKITALAVYLRFYAKISIKAANQPPVGDARGAVVKWH
jgi:hypothetical protein